MVNLFLIVAKRITFGLIAYWESFMSVRMIPRELVNHSSGKLFMLFCLVFSG
jgi:hypothetical protein